MSTSLSDREIENLAACVWGAGSRTRSPLLQNLLREVDRIIAERETLAAIEATNIERRAAILYGDPDGWCRQGGMNRSYWRRAARRIARREEES